MIEKETVMVGKWIMVLIFVALLPFSTAADDLTGTKVLKFIASPEGQIKNEGYCWTNSIAATRPDAWRCMAGNEIFDPCFQSSDRTSVQCDPDPAKRNAGFRLKLTQPLPKPDIPTEAEAMSKGNGWLIELYDGTLCRPATGARGLVDDKMVTCYCENELLGTDIVLLDELDSSSPTWMAEKATLVPGPDGPKLLKSEKVAVKTVWQ
jgi:hypothetical protein